METTEIITPIGKQKLVLKKNLTGRDRRSIESVLLEGFQVSVEDGKKSENTAKINGSQITKMIDKSIEAVVISINGSTEKILDTIIDMNEEDYNYIVTEVQKITDKTENLKKNS